MENYVIVLPSELSEQQISSRRLDYNLMDYAFQSGENEHTKG